MQASGISESKLVWCLQMVPKPRHSGNQETLKSESLKKPEQPIEPSLEAFNLNLRP